MKFIVCYIRIASKIILRSVRNAKRKKISGGNSGNPGTSNWINGLGQGGKKSSGGSSAIGQGFNNQIGQCIAWGLSGLRGPQGCGG